MDLRELIRTPATHEDPSQQLSRVHAMLKAAWVVPYGQAVMVVPNHVHMAYAASLVGRDFSIFKRGTTLTFAGCPVVPQHDDNNITVISHDARTRHWAYAEESDHRSRSRALA